MTQYSSLKINPNKNYTFESEKSLKICNLALINSTETDDNDDDTVMMIEIDEQPYVLCHLNRNNRSSPCYLKIEEGRCVKVYSEGCGEIEMLYEEICNSEMNKI